MRLVAVMALVALALTGGCRCRSTSDRRETLSYGGIEREYVVHLPHGDEPEAPAPLVLALHGGSGTARGMARVTGFDEVADREGFIVVYPEGLDRQWNDGRVIVDHGPRLGIDDVGFLVAVVERVAVAHVVDRRRVYATGISNGAMMSLRLAVERPDVFTAVAGVAGAVSEVLASGRPPAAPVPVMLVNGTEDTLVPFAGGDVTVLGRPRGKVLSTPASVAYWVEHNGAEPDGVETALPDRDPNDGARVERIEFRHRSGADVVLVRVQGGGHTWPGGLQYLPPRMIGRTSRDVDASELIWDFFATHPRR